MEVLEAAPREESRPGKADHHPEPRVAVLPVTAASKRTQGVHGPRDRAPKEVVVGAHTFSLVEGNTDGPCGRVRRSCRGLRPGHVHMGCPGTWEISPTGELRLPRLHPLLGPFASGSMDPSAENRE